MAYVGSVQNRPDRDAAELVASILQVVQTIVFLLLRYKEVTVGDELLIEQAALTKVGTILVCLASCIYGIGAWQRIENKYKEGTAW